MKENNENILLTYLSGKTTEAECQMVEEWYNSSPDNRQVLEQLYYTRFLSDRVILMNSIDTEKKLEEFKESIRNRKVQRKLRKTRLYISRFIAAAALIGILFSAWKAFEYISDTATVPYVLETGLGGRVLATLPDNSKVWIGACTKLEYQNSLGSMERRVNLEGEAYFDVAHKDNVPFIVYCQDLKTEVLGTKFNIRANSDEKIVTITLLEGSICMNSPLLGNNTILMSPQQQFTYNTVTGESNLYLCESAKESISWIHGALHFDKATLGEIAQRLEDYYNVNIQIDDNNLLQERFTCEFDTKENIYHILSILKMTNKFDYRVKQRHIEIYPK